MNQQHLPRLRAMTYSAPDGSTVFNPSLEFLRSLIFEGEGQYWTVGSGDSSLSVVEDRGERHIAILDDEPALAFFLVEPHGFFFSYSAPKDATGPSEFVPLMGARSRPWVEHGLGGESFYAPRSCFVPRAVAWEVVAEFVQSKQKSSHVTWVDRETLEFPFPAAGDEVPDPEDLA